MKNAIAKGFQEGLLTLMVLMLLGFISVGMAEVGKLYPALVITFYVCLIFSIPIGFNIATHRLDSKREKEAVS